MRYPQKLCIPCRKKLDLWSKFRERCLRSQTQYRKEFLNNLEILEQPEEKPIKLETVLIKEEPSLEMTVEMEPDPAREPVTKIQNNKPEKYWDWSDDEFFAPTDDHPPIDIQSSVKLNNEESEEEFYELITVEDNDDDDNKEENIETEKSEEKYSSTESEPDCFDFNPPKAVKKPRASGARTGIKPFGICHICGKTLLTQSMQNHLNWHYGQ